MSLQENPFNNQPVEETTTVYPTNSFSEEPETLKPKPCPPGHYKSIQAGGIGHYPGDKCGCGDGNIPNVSINGYIPFIIILAIVMIVVTILIRNRD